MQLFHGVVETPLGQQGHNADGRLDRLPDGNRVIRTGPAQHPGGDFVFMTRMANADPEAMEPAVTELCHGVAQTVLPAMPAIEFEARRARRQIELIMGQQACRLRCRGG